MTTAQFLRHHAALAALLVCSAVTSTAWADKPEWAGGGKHGKGHGGHEKREHDGDKKHERKGGGKAVKKEIKEGHYFDERQRSVVKNYYGEQFRRGHCPPGLAKKNNGCLPPGQAKKYTVGQNLPTTVVFYPVPSTVTVKLGAPPAGYKYVRVASDILLIAVGSRLVVDAIEDLSRL